MSHFLIIWKLYSYERTQNKKKALKLDYIYRRENKLSHTPGYFVHPDQVWTNRKKSMFALSKFRIWVLGDNFKRSKRRLKSCALFFCRVEIYVFKANQNNSPKKRVNFRWIGQILRSPKSIQNTEVESTVSEI